jgi:hypothetical protein
MNLRKLPPSMLVVLGLSCTRTPPTVHPCLSQPYDPATEDVGPCLSPPDDVTEPDTTEDTTEPEPDDGTEPPVGPCLSPPQPQAMLDVQPDEPTAGGGRPSSSLPTDLSALSVEPYLAESYREPKPGTSGKARPRDRSTVNVCLSAGMSHTDSDARPEPAIAPVVTSRREALDRVLARAALPPDVAERLRQRNEDLD